MSTYIALLRGINVSGQKKILMADLKALFESHGFKNVKTYIQSGNIIFDTFKDVEKIELAKAIENGIENEYNFKVPVIVKNANELQMVINNNPLLTEVELDAKKVAVAFLDQTPAPENLQQLKAIDFSPDRFIVDGKYIYLNCPEGFGRTKITNSFLERKLNVIATSRNWRTITKLVEMAR